MVRRDVALVVLSACLALHDATARAAGQDYADLSLEQLMSIEITSAAKRPVSIVDTPAAAFALTGDDIRRMGARSIPEALRMVPGLNVAQVSASNWAVSARGFNGRFANKLLVLVDGRSVYTPLFSGVFWDQNDILLEDIDRIEVIRGPGASLWGANAVNGVINIITKRAADTQGTYLSGTVGNNDERRSEFRHGGPIEDSGHYRVYGQGFQQGARPEASGSGGADDWRSGSGGFRADFTGSAGDVWSLQGGAFSNVLGGSYLRPTLTAPYAERREDDFTSSGTFLQGGWTRELAPDNVVQVRSFVQRTVINDERFGEERTTVDLEADHRRRLGERHTVVWGVGGRYTVDSIEETSVFGFVPNSDDHYLVDGFVQDTIGFWNNAVEVTLGTKVGYNSYTGVEFQPSARALWHVDDRHTLWAAVSRAIRTPSRAETGIDLGVGVIPPSAASAGLPTDVRVQGSRSQASEELLAYEVGYRWQLDRSLSVDLAGFYNIYDRVLSADNGQPYFSMSGGVPHFVQPLTVNNDGEARVYGFELLGNWRPSRNVSTQAWYALLKQDREDAHDPEHSLAARLQFNLGESVTLDAAARYVGSIASADIDGYANLGVRLAWRPLPYLELAIAGQNLLHDEHLEFDDNGLSVLGLSTQTERSVYGTATLRF